MIYYIHSVLNMPPEEETYVWEELYGALRLLQNCLQWFQGLFLILDVRYLLIVICAML